VSYTLAISDLHLGARVQRGVLGEGRPGAALERLLAAVRAADRVLLLGDVVDLIEAGPRRALEAAAPVLREIGRAVGRGGELILVPGNHDRPLIGPWLRRVGPRLCVSSEVPRGAAPGLEALRQRLAGAPLRVHYPGVWLADGVFATHGHYLDLHLLPVSTYGLDCPGRRASGALRAPIDYERGRRVPVESALARLPDGLRALLGRGAELTRGLALPLLRGGLLPAEITSLTARLLSLQVHGAAIPALCRAAAALGVNARWILFGHVHRLGPLGGEEARVWRGPGGVPRVANTGSWVWEPLLVGGACPPHPYWPGGALRLEESGEPRAVGLLDDLPAELLGASPAPCSSS
jgi:hypothetical protein